MVNLVASTRRLFHRSGIAQVAPGKFARQAFKRAEIGALANQRTHRGPARQQRSRDMASYKAVGARY
jgi:hypothetical protein